jgi:hypothetical protein
MRFTNRFRTVLAVTAASLAAVVGLSTPASASPHLPLNWCFTVDGHIHCYPIPVSWDWRDDCPNCGVLIDWRNDAVINPAVETGIDRYLGNGLTGLGAATTTTDPALAARLRTAALDEVTQAARLAGSSRLVVSQACIADPTINRGDPSPDPWRQAAGVDLADAVTMLQSALTDPANATHYRSAAATQLDNAYQELAQQRVIG